MKIEREIPSSYISSWIPLQNKSIIYENLTFTTQGSGTLTVAGNGTSSVSIFKTAGSAAWDTQAYVSTGFTAPITLEFTKNASATDDGISYAMISLNADPTANASYTSLDYASYPYMTNTYSVYHNGTQVLSSGAWAGTNRFYLVYEADGFIRHYNGSTQLYSINYGSSTVYIDSSFYSVNAFNGGFTSIRLTKNIWNGTQYI